MIYFKFGWFIFKRYSNFEVAAIFNYLLNYCIMIGKNVKFLRNYSGLNQTEFGKLFGITRGMIDTYEREKAKPSFELLNRVAKHFNLSLEAITQKDLTMNPGLLYSGASVEEQKSVVNGDLLAAKDEQIKLLKEQNKFLQEQVKDLTRQLEFYSKKIIRT